jgi:hypothetical protein
MGWAQGSGGSDASATLGQIEQDLSTVEQRLAHLRETYVVPAQLENSYHQESRFADGRLLFLLEDYGRASVVFYDLVESTPDPNTPGYREARYYLAESLYQSGNFFGARGFFEEAAEDRADPRRYDALRRLLEIAFTTRHYEGIDELFDQLDSAGAPLRPDIQYIRGKTQYFRGNYREAIREFNAIPYEDPHYVQAQYFAGVSQVRQGDLDMALSAFEAALDGADASGNPDAAEIRDLAHMAVARVHYERGEMELALDAYQQVSRSSEHYDRALYEMCWTYLRLDRLADALRTLEILMLAVPDSRFLPNARLLRADILMRMSRYDQALELFDSTVAELTPLSRELATLVTEETDPSLYFDSLIDAGSASLTLPDLAREWVEEDPSMRRALALIADVQAQHGQLAEARQIIDDLQTVLGSSSRFEVYPELRSGYGHGLELQMGLLFLVARLADVQSDLVLPTLDGEAQAQYRTLRERRLEVEVRLRELPLTYQEMVELEASFEDNLHELEMQVYRLGYEVETQNAQLTAVRLQLREDHAAGEWSDAEFAQLQAELETFASQLDELEAERNRLARRLEEQRLRTGLDSVTGAGHSDLRQRYEASLSEELRFLARRRDAVPDARRGQLADFDRLRGQVDAAEGQLESYFAELDRILGQRTAEIVRQIDIEVARLDEYERQLRRYGSQGERLAGEIAFENFIAVQGEFNDLIMRADVGIIDVAWQEKEERSERIEMLFDERTEQLNILDAEFREVLSDE